jgi:hypothetical protein
MGTSNAEVEICLDSTLFDVCLAASQALTLAATATIQAPDAESLAARLPTGWQNRAGWWPVLQTNDFGEWEATVTSQLGTHRSQLRPNTLPLEVSIRARSVAEFVVVLVQAAALQPAGAASPEKRWWMPCSHGARPGRPSGAPGESASGGAGSLLMALLGGSNTSWRSVSA